MPHHTLDHDDHEICGVTKFRCYRTQIGAIIEGARVSGQRVEAVLCPYCGRYHWTKKRRPLFPEPHHKHHYRD